MVLRRAQAWDSECPRRRLRARFIAQAVPVRHRRLEAVPDATAVKIDEQGRLQGDNEAV
jgi:hypothetical protein